MRAVTIDVDAIATARAADLRRDLWTVLFGIWMIAGLFADGWAHLNLAATKESFFTPSHGVLYAGFAAGATFTGLPALRAHGSVRDRLDALPPGYGLGFAGAILFGAGGVLDLVWHGAFGIEVSIEALLSPTHLLLMVGGLLFLSTPVRSAWQRPDSDQGLSALLPTILGTAVVTALLAFFFAYAWGLLDPSVVLPVDPAAFGEAAPGHFLAERQLGAGIVNRLLATVLLVGPLVLLSRRWRLPVGTATIVFTLVAGLVAVLYADIVPVLPTIATVIAALVTDGLLVWLRPGPTSRHRTWAFAASASATTVAVTMAAWHLAEGITWPLELWTGTIVLGAVVGFGLGLLAAVPANPDAGVDPRTRQTELLQTELLQTTVT